MASYVLSVTSEPSEKLINIDLSKVLINYATIMEVEVYDVPTYVKHLDISVVLLEASEISVEIYVMKQN